MLQNRVPGPHQLSEEEMNGPVLPLSVQRCDGAGFHLIKPPAARVRPCLVINLLNVFPQVQLGTVIITVPWFSVWLYQSQIPCIT